MTIETPKNADLLRWWHQYQAQLMNQTADRIRNGMLQEVFAVRRQLELACDGQSRTTFGCNQHLAALERVQSLLENLSDRLDSPYLQDSLPLTLQHAAQPWQEKVRLTLELPTTWEPDPVEHTRLLMMLIEHLLEQLAAEVLLPSSCLIGLEQQHRTKQLTCHVDYDDLVLPAAADQLDATLAPFLQTFQLFTQGNYEYRVQPRSLDWVLRWSA